MGGKLYGEDYYKYYAGFGYDRKEEHWLKFFGDIADMIIKEFGPDTVLDAGCAKGFLVESLRDRGVEAYGIDISEYAISEVRDDMRPYCKVASITDTDSFDREYDLITCIEVLEHLTVPEGKEALKNICSNTDTVIFSSTPDDLGDPTHINVQPADYWIKMFNNNGFTGDLSYDLSYISPHAILFKRDTNISDAIREKTALKKEIEKIKNQRDKNQYIIDEIFSSNSWKLTRPFRVLGRLARKIIKLVKSIFSFKNLKRTISYYKRFGLKDTFYKIRENISSKKIAGDYDSEQAYKKWIKNNENYNQTEIKKNISSFTYNPKISVIMPVYNVKEKWLRKCIDSVRSQYYENWELCIADDNSSEKYIGPVLEEYMERDKRIKVVFREENGHIAKASNSALKLASGEFIALLDNDDELPSFALYEVVKLINKHPEADLIYSDEDKIDERGNRRDPHFKPGWSPDTLLSCNYITHLGVYRKEIIDDIGGFRLGYEGSQDYDLVLRFTEKTKNIYHIPKVLYHWRMIKGSTSVDISNKNYAYMAGYRALVDTVKRRKYNAEVCYTEGLPFYNIRFNCNQNENLISIIIPTKDKADILKKCLYTIYKKNSYSNFEVIIIDNGSLREKTFQLFDRYKKQYDNFKIKRLDIPFNYSKLNNEAVNIAKGNLLLFLNNDIELITDNCLKIMAGQARRKNTGAVGAKLLYPDGKIQHGGVILGMGGIAANAYRMSGGYNTGYVGRLRVNYNYSAVTAACMMVKKLKFEEVNGFEESLSVAFNDVDFCLKLFKKGYYNVLLPEVELYHHESLSRGKEDNPEKLNRFNEEARYMKEKWGHLLKDDPFYNSNLSLAHCDFRIRD